ncbi:MAG TPA: AMP-binding protein [Nodosilinea sp.]|nr:AMP-binding protein [Nodosilinea sp.]
MADALETLLQTRWGEDWLVGPRSADFWALIEQLRPLLAAAHPHSPAADSSARPAWLIAEPDPLKCLAGCLAAWAEGCPVVLANPGWGQRELAQVQALVSPAWDAPLLPTVGGYPCWVPGAQPGQILIPTGGSSGQIKFAIHTWASLMAAVAGFRRHFGVGPVQAYCVLPLFHVSGLMQALRVLASGGQLALQPYRALHGGERLRLPPGGFISLVPTQLQELLAQGGEFLPWLRSFRAVLLGGAPAGRSLLDQAQAARIPVALTYGMTETAAQVATLLPEEFLAGHRSSGRPLPHAQLTILNDRGEPQGAGQVGQVVIGASSLAQGYWGGGEILAGTAHPTALGSGDCSRDPMVSSGFATDDLGYLDAGGYLHILGRRSTKLITGGENVSPEEIEAALLATGWVSDACVVGLPCDRWGQRLCALVVMHDSKRLPELSERLRSQLAPYKLPKQWILVSELPRTAQGKLSRPQALRLAQTSLGLDG